jgi:hypothetical protein
MIDRISYKKGYKYWLARPYSLHVPIFPEHTLVSSGGFVTLGKNGVLAIKLGYAWDGPSGPTFDTKTFMRGSLIHDSLYQIMREGLLDNSYRKQVDELLGRICRSDGMNGFRAGYVVWAVKRFAGAASDPKNRKSIVRAP